MLDVVIRGGTVVDGSGGPSAVSDVGVRGGRIVSVGRVDEPAAETVDATGLVVAPGFVDVHTHLDGQLLWDPTGSPSTLHGVTTVIGGNCGFSIAPMDPERVDYVARMLSVVEGIPLESLRAGLDWEWHSFGEWLDRFDAQGLGPNAGFMVGHSTLRAVVMGDEALERPATEEETVAMGRLLGESLSAGGLGFSTSWLSSHIDDEGRPVPSRAASPDECVALAAVARDYPGTMIQLSPGRAGIALPDAVLETMIQMGLAAGQPVNWSTIRLRTPDAALVESLLRHCSTAAERGVIMAVLAFPDRNVSQLSLRSGMVFDGLPGWAEVMHAPLEERMRLLADPEVRHRLREGARRADTQLLRFVSEWGALLIMETFSPSTDGLVGRTVGEVAAERGQDPFDTFLDISLQDRLRTYVRMPPDDDSDEMWALRLAIWRDERTILGDSDAGAHMDFMCGARSTTAFIGESVYQRHLLTIEEAVHLITDRLARFYGIRDRGRISPGWYGDLVLFDPSAVGPGTLRTRNDLPGGAARLYAEPTGVAGVFVNGRAVVRDGAYTGDLTGTTLRSGRDTWRPADGAGRA